MLLFMFVILVFYVGAPYITLATRFKEFNKWTRALFSIFNTSQLTVNPDSWANLGLYEMQAFCILVFTNFLYLCTAAFIIIAIKKSIDMEFNQRNLHEVKVQDSFGELNTKLAKFLLDLESHFDKTDQSDKNTDKEDTHKVINLLWVDELLQSNTSGYNDNKLLEYLVDSQIRVFPLINIDEVLRFLEALFKLKVK
jgi:hypothetical protein